MAQIMIIEDEVLLAKSLARSLTNHGHECILATCAEEGLDLLDRMPPDIVLIDLHLPGMSGFEAMKAIYERDPDIAVIVITAYGTMASVVEAMRTGASDFLRKPVDTEELALAIDRAMADARLKHTVAYYHDREAEKTDENKLICNSIEMKKISKILKKVTTIDLPKSSNYPPVLILGETGVGKDLIARIIHYRSKFSNEPFVEVNCSSLPKGLEEAELFGYEKGAFTGAHRSKRGLFETAEKGTIFLNEIGDLSLEAQVKMLRVIENKCIRHVGGLRDIVVDVRIIAATNRELTDKSLFREDLYHRLNNITIQIPSLINRKEDIIDLAKLFLEKYCHKYNTNKKLSEESETALKSYPWPGNVRELRQLIERATFLSSSTTIGAKDLYFSKKPQTAISIDQQANILIDFPENGIDFDVIEKEIIIQALIASNGNISEAARKLNLGREAVRYRIKKYSISKLMKIVG